MTTSEVELKNLHDKLKKQFPDLGLDRWTYSQVGTAYDKAKGAADPEKKPADFAARMTDALNENFTP